MKKYIFRRLLLLPLILLILSFFLFSLVSFLTPYERLAVFIPNPDVLSRIPVEELIRVYGLDQPFLQQYYNWFKNIMQGNLGWSASARMPVGKALAKKFPATIELLVLGQLIILFAGVTLGTIAGVRHNQIIDNVIKFFATFAISLPGFVIGIYLLVIFYAVLGFFPPGRLSNWATDVVLFSDFKNYTNLNLVDSLLNLRFDVFWDALRHLIAPSFAYSVSTLATTIRLMRSSLLETLHKDYVRTARAKGLKENIVIKKHARRNALLPIVTFIGTSIPVMFGGSVIIETVFNYPGIGLFIIQAAQGLDFPAILGSGLLVGTVIVLTNLTVDIIYHYLDPTIGYD
ncbi:Dipeptide transport system permease protein DppB [subsurface metagenome]